VGGRAEKDQPRLAPRRPADPTRTVREQFLIELAAPGALAKIDGLTGLNELFSAWVETVYHQRVHSETGQTPLARFLAADPPALPTPAQLHQAFLWSEHRLVAKTATVSLHGNTYQVDAALVGRRVELVFDPFDLSELSVRYQGREMGTAIGHQVGRHVHPAAKPQTSPDATPVTGIDYLSLVRDRHTAALTERVNYAGLTQLSAYYFTCRCGYDLTCRSRRGDHGMVSPPLTRVRRSLSR
jgi:putative transposase